MEQTKPQTKIKQSTSSNFLFGRPKTATNKKKIDFENNYLYSAKFDKFAKENSKRQGYLIKDKDNQRQLVRKQMFKVSNPIDNYYFPKYHDRSWWPNGKYILKRRYNYTEIGLEHNYERNNVEQLAVIEEAGNGKKKETDFLKEFSEYDNLKPGQYIITIEYCSSCEEHASITQHSGEHVFKDLALHYQRIIQERFPFIQVCLKPIDVEIVKNIKYKCPRTEKNGMPCSSVPPLTKSKINDKINNCFLSYIYYKIK